MISMIASRSIPFAIATATFAALIPGTALAKSKTIAVVERATTDAVTDLGAQGDSVGDLLTFANEVYDEKNQNKVGTDQGWCIRVIAGTA